MRGTRPTLRERGTGRRGVALYGRRQMQIRLARRYEAKSRCYAEGSAICRGENFLRQAGVIAVEMMTAFELHEGEFARIELRA
jgi:hypothetical protein